MRGEKEKKKNGRRKKGKKEKSDRERKRNRRLNETDEERSQRLDAKKVYNKKSRDKEDYHYQEHS